MGSSLGFKNTADENKSGKPRKKTVSRGLLVAGGLLLVVLIAFGLLKMLDKSLNQQVVDIQNQINNVNAQLSTALTEEASDFSVRAMMMEDEIYRGYDSNAVLHEIENIMILKNSDNSGERVVLKSFQHNAGAYDKKTNNGQEVMVVGSGSVTITADADSFNVMAQQIDVFKKSSYFENVQVGTTDRDDFGRIIFTLTMDVVGYDKTPYEESQGSTLVAPTEQATINVTDAQNDTEVIVGEDGVYVQTGDTEVTANDDGASVQTDNTDIQAGQ